MNKISGKNKLLLFTILFVIMCSAFFSYDKNFQADSETLVTGPLRGNIEHIDKGIYPLGRYIGIDGIMMNYSKREKSKQWKDGYSVDEPALVISNNNFSKEFVEKLAIIKDKIGNEYTVEDYTYDGDYIRLKLPSGVRLSKEINGSLTELQYFDANGDALSIGKISDYKSQFGLQGLILENISPKGLSYLKIRNIARGVCIVILAAVLIAICYLIGKKYNWLLAGAYYVTFCTSPWIVNFAPNLYWVEFTWFIPMLIGLGVTMTNMCFKYRFLAYCGALTAITVKCLCGYEYISTIIMGMIMFPLVDMIISWKNGDGKRTGLYLKLALGLCIVGVVGFWIALTMHGYVRGDGNIYTGLQDIYQHDVLRRTLGGNAADFPKVYENSLNASILSVVYKYMIFNTKIVLGIPGKLFPVIALLPMVISYYYKRKDRKLFSNEVWGLYIISFLATTSWYVLAKAHSYIHVHMNYVLWYFGFVQICIYGLLLMIRNKCIEKLLEHNVLSTEWQGKVSKWK